MRREISFLLQPRCLLLLVSLTIFLVFALFHTGKVAQLKVDGVAFRLVPESTQLKNALKERKTAGFADDDFNGVPVFQSKSLILRS